MDLVIVGDHEEKISIGTYMGTMEESNVNDTQDEEYPKDTLLACSSWFAGAGDYLCITRKSGNALSVQWKEKDEGWVEGEEPETSKFHEIKVIEIHENAIVEVLRQSDAQ